MHKLFKSLWQLLRHSTLALGFEIPGEQLRRGKLHSRALGVIGGAVIARDRGHQDRVPGPQPYLVGQSRHRTPPSQLHPGVVLQHRWRLQPSRLLRLDNCSPSSSRRLRRPRSLSERPETRPKTGSPDQRRRLQPGLLIRLTERGVSAATPTRSATGRKSGPDPALKCSCPCPSLTVGKCSPLATGC